MKNSTGLTIRQPMAGVFHIGDPFGVYASLILGSRQALLVDTTTGVCDLAAAVRALTDLPVITVNTHAHADHIGGNRQFGPAYLSDGEMSAVGRNASEQMRRVMLGLMPEALLPDAFDESGFLTAGADEFLSLAPDAVFELGGETVETVSIPTHTQGSVGFLCRRRRLLLTGDAAASQMSLHLPESSSLQKCSAVLQQLNGRNDFDAMLSAHSDALLPKRKLNTLLACLDTAEESRSFTVQDPFFPKQTAKKYTYIGSDGDVAILLYPNGEPAH